MRDFINLFSEHVILVPLAYLGLWMLIDTIGCEIRNTIRVWKEPPADNDEVAATIEMEGKT